MIEDLYEGACPRPLPAVAWRHVPHSYRIDRLHLRAALGGRLRARLWREWCFVRAVISELGLRLLLLVALLIVGALLFQTFEPQRRIPFVQAVYYTFSLLFAQPPESFPAAIPLRVLFFAVPILGLTVIIESMIELAQMLRDRRRSEQSWCKIMAQSHRDHVVIVGLGKLGYRTFLILRRLGHRAAVVEQNEQNQFLDEVRKDGSPFLIGDARRESLLAEAGIARARAVVVCTDNDLTNLEVALDARRLAPGIRVVLRMFDQTMADKVAGAAGIKVAMSQSSISAPAFATAALEPSTVGSVVLDTSLVIMQRWTLRAGGPLAGLTVGESIARHHVNIVERSGRDGVVGLFPAPDTRLEPDDQLVVQGTYDTLLELRPAAAE